MSKVMDEMLAKVRAWALIDEAYRWGCNDPDLEDRQVVPTLVAALNEMGAPGADTELALKELADNGEMIVDEGTPLAAFVGLYIENYYAITYRYPDEITSKVVIVPTGMLQWEQYEDGSIYAGTDLIDESPDFLRSVFDHYAECLF